MISKSPCESRLSVITVLQIQGTLWMRSTKGATNEAKNLSYIPLPNPTLLKLASIPTVGTIARSIFFTRQNELPECFRLNLPFPRGSLNGTILKLISRTNGTKIVIFLALSFLIVGIILTSIFRGRYANIFLLLMPKQSS